ncbi:TonB-dependent receptor [Sphingomonas sp. ABOLD]|nr:MULTISPECIES: TonB-dependent receptor [unclassified Sphingomonas]RSV37330.1 TonB-dependent receptor [Sphingomonas sp. ABOLE]RSV45592.1 TonB-dependent receptor [Sphingomonas sp. ABOLD]
MMGAAHAQTAAEEPQTGATQVDEAQQDQIVVTGIRASLATAQSIKRNSDTVVDAITSQDIGSLPDRSVTEALQRVPGVSINRFAGSNDPDHFSVEGSGVAVRGLTFVRSEFNGRTAFAAGVGGQALNFADVPSELLGSVIVAKNTTADMIEGGLAGTVNLNTRKPFDRTGLHAAMSLEANYGDMRKKWTPTISGLISNTWDTGIGRFGLLASGAFSQIKSRSDGIQVANYQTRDNTLVNAANTDGTLVCRNPLPSSTDTTTLPAANAPCGTAGGAGADGFADFARSRVAPAGGQFRTQEFNRKRDGMSLAAQFESIDHRTTLTAEYVRSHTTQEWSEYTFETAPDLAEYTTYPKGCLQNSNGPNTIPADGSAGAATSRAECPVGQFQDFQYDANGLFQSGYIVNTSNGWRGDPSTSPYVPIGGLQQSLARRQSREETLNQDWSLRLKTDLTDRLTVTLDGQVAKSRRQHLDFSVFGSSFADQELDISGKIPSVTPHKPQYLGYNWSTPDSALANATDAQYFNDPRFQFWRAAMDHFEDSTGTQYAFQGDVEYKFDEDSFLRRVKFGARYQDRDQTVRYSTYNWGMLSETWSGSRPVNFADTPASMMTRYNFPNFFRGQTGGPPGAFYYGGDMIRGYDQAVKDFQAVQAIATGLGASPTWVPASGRARAIAGTPYLPSEIQPVSQLDTAAYGMASFGSDTLFGSVRFSGNVGLRWVRTNVRSEGRIGVPSQAELNILEPFADRCALEVPPNAPPGTLPQPQGGVCTLGPTGYAQLQQFAGAGFDSFDAAKTSYSYLLPSVNLKFGLSDKLLVRLAGSKVLTRPDNANIRNFLTIGLGTSGELTATTGNPYLRPATAWQFDASLEWYFASVGSLTLNGFYKAIDGFFYQKVTNRSLTSNGVTKDVFVRGPANYEGTGKIKGFELAYQQTYDFLPGPLKGLGISANYTFIDSSGLPNSFLNGGSPSNVSTVTPSGSLPLEQLSKHNVNAAVFYELGGISVRAAYNWRSRFLLTASDVIFPYFSIFNEPVGTLDASLFVNLTKNVKLGVQGVNLTNTITKTTQAYTGDPKDLAPRSYFMNDRRFSFILRGSF